jgi:hypothetical protein
MAGDVRKENLLRLSNVIARRQLVVSNATGFACQTLAVIAVDSYVGQFYL